MTTDTGPVLEVDDLHVEFRSMRGVVRVLDGIGLCVRKGEILGLVGESGCGKTVTGLAIMRLLQPPQAQVTAGRVMFNGENLLSKSETQMQDLRGKELAMVFQDPLASLNPVFTVGHQISSVVQRHERVSSRAAREVTLRTLASVGLPSSDSLFNCYPHQLSGGMRQRICLAMALSCGAPLLIGDEPTTALDVTIQAQILRLLLALRDERGMAMIVVTHNLGVAAQTCDRIAVMYAGNIVEQGSVTRVLTHAHHPYTIALYDCLPKGESAREMATIPGSVPDLVDPPTGCRFHPRCAFAMEVCRTVKPLLKPVGLGHEAACHYVEGRLAASRLEGA
jgi:peptide/nickel transport system ATP-binding protein